MRMRVVIFTCIRHLYYKFILDFFVYMGKKIKEILRNVQSQSDK